MTNKEKYVNAFMVGLEISKNQAVPGLNYQGIENWDSVGHMSLIAELESEFDIMFEMDDIIDLSSFEKGIEILEKYGINIQ